ncbi:MAG: restriction endonuclease subunit S [Helicobacteraceae bacterium]|jgi:hypothetical protein|nr:restriction endonuclease subunit S [Helicobacteraceae bacterium]
MKVEDLFVLHQGNGLELMHIGISDNSNINFVSRTAQNNGVVAQVDKIENINPFTEGSITVALGGSVLSAFVQLKPFYTAFHIMVLIPKQKMSLQEKLFYCMCIKANAYKYSYGRQANKTLKDIELPDTIPDWIYSISVEPIKTAVKPKKLPPLNTEKWGEFELQEIFRFENCKCSIARELSDGDDCYYIGAKKNDNGIMRKVAYDEDLISKGNSIIFICNGQGAVGYSLYMNNDFIGTTSNVVGYNSMLNKYSGLFIVSVLDLERPKFSFGRKWYRTLPNTVIKLPQTKQGAPDWTFMENYIKSLPYSDRI